MKYYVRPPYEWSAIHPAFRIPEWAAIGKPTISAQDLSRHVLAIGQTGAGKTVSAIKPLLHAAYHYPQADDYARYAQQARAAGLVPDSLDDLRPSALVVDPKAELGEAVAAMQFEHPELRKVIYLGASDRAQVIWYFENMDVKDMNAIEVTDHILSQSFYLEREKRARDPYWGRRAEALIRMTLEINHFVYRKGGLDALKHFWSDVSANVISAVAGDYDTNETRYLRQALAEQPLRYNRGCYLQPMATLFNLSATFHTSSGSDPVLSGYLLACQKHDIPYGKQYEIMALRQMPENTHSSIISVLNNVFEELGSEDLAQFLSLNPYEAPESLISVTQIMDEGHFLIFTPSDQFGLADTVGRVLKAKFFSYALRRQNRARPFFYIADEAQRYISADPLSGEQSFLDRCRAYRCSSILATQSIASLRFSVAAADNGPDSAALGTSSLQSVLQNIGNAHYFRTVDGESTSQLMQMIPNPPIQGKPHIVQVRPLASLQVGEAYYLFADGRMGKGRVGYTPAVSILPQLRHELVNVLDARIAQLSQTITRDVAQLKPPPARHGARPRGIESIA